MALSQADTVYHPMMMVRCAEFHGSPNCMRLGNKIPGVPTFISNSRRGALIALTQLELLNTKVFQICAKRW